MARFLTIVATSAMTMLGAATIGAGSAAAEVLRLGFDVVPKSQAIDLVIDADQPDYRGTVTVSLGVETAVNRFRFHARTLEIQSLVLQGEDGVLPTRFETGEQDTVEVVVETEYPLAPGKRYTLQIEFTKQLNTRGLSLYRVVQESETGPGETGPDETGPGETGPGETGYVFSQFQDIEAREAFPCWDEPIFKIPYQLTITVPEAHTALTNTPVIETSVTEDGMKQVVFARTPPLPSYLLAIAAGPFERVEIPSMSIPGHIYTVAGQSDHTDIAIDATPKILAALEAWFDRPYPYAKLDFVAIPEYWYGAMENPGLIAYREGLLVIDPAHATTRQRSGQARVIAHELAHIWFGDLVTMMWWDDLWLNEAFADWMAIKIAHQVFPELGLDIAFTQGAQNAMVGDARATTKPVKIPVDSMDNLLQNVGLAYAKGKAVLDAFEQWLGEDAFRRGVLRYIEAHAWGNAEGADLWRQLDRVSELPVSKAMATFIEQPGVPQVDVRPAGDGHVTLSQQRFHDVGVELEPMRWQIPVSLRWPKDAATDDAAADDGAAVGGTETRTILLGDEPITVRLSDADPAWILPLAEGRGYYRWTLPSETVESLVGIATESLTPREQVAVAGNLGALLRGGLIDGGQYLSFLSAFGDARSPQVLSALISAIAGVEEALVPEDVDNDFGAYLRRTLGPALDRFGMTRQAGENELVADIRARLIGWLGDEGAMPTVRAEVDRLRRAFFDDPASVDRALVSTVLRLSAQRGDLKLYDQLRTRFEAAKDPSLRQIYLRSLGSFRDPAIRQRALAYSLEGSLPPDDLFTIPGGVTDDEAGADLALDWVMTNYDILADRLPPRFRSFLVSFGSGCSAARWTKAERFFGDPKRAVPGLEQQMARTAESVETCLALREREGTSAARYLRTSAEPATEPAAEPATEPATEPAAGEDTTP